DRAMFSNLRTARYLKAQGNSDAAIAEFVGRVQRMANVHHYGLRDRPTPHSEAVKYEVRPLLGLSEKEVKKIEEIIFLDILK
ncbi:phage virion morphogenesis protein, partial [Klebsiella pneumoniae]|uniref:phage virion morphogenesis protein n=1 Tax=Klebsiella pneumoniae TaxID=573 RepID=UPI0015FD1783